VTETHMPKEEGAFLSPPKATDPHFYKYSSLPTPKHLDRLRVIIQENELFLPSLDQLNDPADGRPRLAPLSEKRMGSFLYSMLQQRNPHLTPARLEREREIIFHNLKLHGTKTFHRLFTDSLHSELKDYRIYSMSKRYDNLSLWANYAGDHSGYCLEFVNEGSLFESARHVVYEDTFQMEVDNPEHTKGFWFFYKRPEWSNEEEVRLVLQRNKGSKVKIAPKSLQRLILGKSVSKHNEEAIRDWALQRVPSLKVVKAYYDTVEQKIKLEPDQSRRNCRGG